MPTEPSNQTHPKYKLTQSNGETDTFDTYRELVEHVDCFGICAEWTVYEWDDEAENWRETTC